MKSLQDQLFLEYADKSLLTQAQQASFDYLDGQMQRDLVPTDADLAKLSDFDEPFPTAGSAAQDVIQRLTECGAPNTITHTGGRYFGFVNGSVLPVAAAARWLADTWDQNAALQVMSPIAAKLEAVVEQWLVELFRLPQQAVTGFVGGTSVATLCGLSAARFRQLQKLNWDVNQKGLFGAPRLRFILGTQTHGTVIKMLTVLGVGHDAIEWVEADDQGRMFVDQVPDLDSSCVLVLQAGNVNTGAYDNFSALCAKANEAGAWVHIDGAFGLWAAASEKLRHLTHGIELAQSWSADGHKTLNTPYDCGMVLCSDKEALVSALHQQGSYIQFGAERDGMVYTPDMSRRARGIEMWAALKYLGQSGTAALVELLHERAKEFARLLRANGFDVMNDVVFNQVMIDVGDGDAQSAFLQHVQQSGDCWCGGAAWKGKPIVRFSVCSWATTEEDLKRTLTAFLKARDFANTQQP